MKNHNRLSDSNNEHSIKDIAEKRIQLLSDDQFNKFKDIIT